MSIESTCEHPPSVTDGWQEHVVFLTVVNTMCSLHGMLALLGMLAIVDSYGFLHYALQRNHQSNRLVELNRYRSLSGGGSGSPIVL